MSDTRDRTAARQRRLRYSIVWWLFMAALPVGLLVYASLTRDGLLTAFAGIATLFAVPLRVAQVSRARRALREHRSDDAE